MNNGNVNNNNKTNTNRVRAVAPVPVASATPQVVYDIQFSTIIAAWIDCERNKRSAIHALNSAGTPPAISLSCGNR